MNRQEILDLYQWADGACFRHPRKGEVPTAHVQTVRPRCGTPEDVRACEECVLQMEQERWAEAGREGVDYEPGHAGEGLGWSGRAEGFPGSQRGAGVAGELPGSAPDSI